MTRTASSTGRTALYGILALAAVIAVALLAPTQGYYLNIMMQAATYAIAVAGVVIVLGYCGQLALCQAAFLGIGAYCVALGTVDYGLPFFVALALGVVVTSIGGIFLGLATLRLGGHYLAMVTIGFQMIVTMVLTNWISFTRGPDGVSGVERPVLGPLDLGVGSHYLALCLAFLVGVTFYAAGLKASRLGRAMQAVRDNEIAASTCGINVFRTKTVAFGISAALGGLGGGLFAGAFSYISPDQFTFNESIVLLTMALLGGVQSPVGALLGTILLVLLPEWLRFLRQAYLAVYGAAVIAIMIFLPRGVWGLVADRFFKAAPVEDGPVTPLPLLGRKGEASKEIVLEISGLAKHFGGLKALDGVDMAVRKGSVHALIGPNGSGKTTMVNVITGLYVATAGRVKLLGRDVTSLAPHERAKLGMCRTYQNIRVFRGLTVLENVTIGAERDGNDVGRRAGHPRAGARRARLRRPARRRRPARGRPALWPPALCRDRPRARRLAGDPAARRARRRPQPHREGRDGGAAQAAEGPRPDHRHHRPRHEADRAGGRPHHRAELRQAHCRWRAARRARPSRSHRRLSGEPRNEAA